MLTEKKEENTPLLIPSHVLHLRTTKRKRITRRKGQKAMGNLEEAMTEDTVTGMDVMHLMGAGRHIWIEINPKVIGVVKGKGKGKESVIEERKGGERERDVEVGTMKKMAEIGKESETGARKEISLKLHQFTQEKDKDPEA
jgi:hypothetical protein